LSDVEIRVEEEAARLRPTDIPRACGDPSLARRMLGWQPEIPWRDTLVDVLNDWRERVRSA
jgi:GDP-4-dehydro-6-deoxy-D-mannose reductase